MTNKQMLLFEDDPAPVRALGASAELGTFKDNKRAPIHNWFKYPAGYSNRFVTGIMDRFDVRAGAWMYDPFSGTGTTLVCAKQVGVNACGVEAHSFVHWVAGVKLYWEFDYSSLETEIDAALTDARHAVRSYSSQPIPDDIFPELIYKCYHPDTLRELYLLRQFVMQDMQDDSLRDLLRLALTDTLRTAAAAGTGWPYIAPRKNTGDKPPKDAYALFSKTVRRMVSDLMAAGESTGQCTIRNVLGDSRQRQDLAEAQIDLALTSPPYLNNYDYGDRTRLETYFWGIAHSWRDITEQFRNKLMVAATTQIVRRNFDVETTLSRDIEQISPSLYRTIQSSILDLSQRRLHKGGKKDYDLMVALYFNDMLAMMRETYRVLRPGGHFCLVLGDSAPYGVHIPTDQVIGEMGLGMGFKHFAYEEFRTRGGKWKANPQRHTVSLREGIVILEK